MQKREIKKLKEVKLEVLLNSIRQSETLFSNFFPKGISS